MYEIFYIILLPDLSSNLILVKNGRTLSGVNRMKSTMLALAFSLRASRSTKRYFFDSADEGEAIEIICEKNAS